MKYQLAELNKQHIPEAVELFQRAYTAEQQNSPLLPDLDSKTIEHCLLAAIEKFGPDQGVAAYNEKTLVGYMMTGAAFKFKGLNAVQVREFCHASIDEDKPAIYHEMYMQLAQSWVQKDIPLHIIGHFAHDEVLTKKLFLLGFGAIIAERLRPLTSIDSSSDHKVVQVENIDEIVNIHFEHFNKYYPQSPIFISKDVSESEVREELEDHLKKRDAILAVYEGDEVVGYMVVGTSAIGEEGFLLQNTNTAQVKSAFAMPDSRAKGLGKALLQAAIKYAKEKKYDRLFVEHETANYYGGNFWEKYFDTYLYFSMRYIDKDLVERISGN